MGKMGWVEIGVGARLTSTYFFMSLQFSSHLDCIFIQNLKN